MSTTFDVIPATDPPATVELLEASQTCINSVLASHAIPMAVTLRAERITIDRRHAFDHGSFVWPEQEGQYIWISIDGVPGGIDVYCTPILRPDSLDEYDLLETFREAPRFNREHMTILAHASEHNLCWTFRRSMGQLPITALSYGLIAASLAKMTGGLVLSEDGAWDYSRFPATGAEMLEWYFQPGKATRSDMGAWASRCLAQIRQSVADGTLGQT